MIVSWMWRKADTLARMLRFSCTIFTFQRCKVWQDTVPKFCFQAFGVQCCCNWHDYHIRRKEHILSWDSCIPKWRRRWHVRPGPCDGRNKVWWQSCKCRLPTMLWHLFQPCAMKRVQFVLFSKHLSGTTFSEVWYSFEKEKTTSGTLFRNHRIIES